MEIMTMEQRLSICDEDKFVGEDKEISDFIDTYIEEFGITRQSGVTLIARNFFTSYNESSIRNHEGFKEYYFSLGVENQDKLKLLFKCMNQDILIELDEENEKRYISAILHHCPSEKPVCFDLIYNESLLKFINAYIVGQINVRVTVDQLLLRILQIENE